MERDTTMVYAPLVLAQRIVSLLEEVHIPWDERYTALKIATELLSIPMSRTGGICRLPIEHEAVSRDAPSQNHGMQGTAALPG